MRLNSVLRVVVVVALLCCVGCNSSNKGKIEGTKWTSLPGNVKGQSIPAGILSLEFGSDFRLVYRAGPITMTGTYSLGWGDYVTLKLDRELEGRKNHTERISISGDRLTMTDSDGTSLTFEKVRDSGGGNNNRKN
jgi:hypothetical protein